MGTDEKKLHQLSQIMHQIIDDWHERVKGNYLTEEDTEQIGGDPEIKCFHNVKRHRIKFRRTNELDVTYALAALAQKNRLCIESSVNNKSSGFDYDAFVNRLESHYWQSQNEKPWVEPDFDHFSYGDLLDFDPLMGRSVSLDLRHDKADIVRLRFTLNSQHEELLLNRPDVLRDLIENYCLAPLKRIYAESYRGQ